MNEDTTPKTDPAAAIEAHLRKLPSPAKEAMTHVVVTARANHFSDADILATLQFARTTKVP